MTRTIKPLALALGLLAAAPAMAGGNDLDDLKKAGNTPSAWQQAQSMRQQWETDPAFDYLYGTLALGQKHYNEAQFALERVVIADPGNLDARIALAQAYYHLGDKQSAAKQFDLIKQANPPADVLRQLNQHMTEAGNTQKGRLMGFVEGTLGHDNNINSATGSDSISNPDFDALDPFSSATVALESNARQQSDMYNAEQAGLDYYQPFDDSNGMEMRGRVTRRDNFSSDRFDSNSYRVSGSLYHLEGRHFLRGTLTAQDYRISDSDNHQYYSLSGDWLGHDFNGWDVFANVFINEMNYSDNLRDIRQYIAQSGVQRQFGDVRHIAGLSLGDEHALNGDADYNARDFVGVFYDVRYFLGGSHQLFGRLWHQESNQKGSEPFFVGETRDDSLQQLSVGWDWQLSKPLRLRTETGYTHNNSDVDYYSYERSWVQTTLRYSF
jgi:tetratricopeptide (TPR) repeat protein